MENFQFDFENHKICIQCQKSCQTLMSRLKYVFIVFFETNQMLKYTLAFKNVEYNAIAHIYQLIHRGKISHIYIRHLFHKTIIKDTQTHHFLR